MRAFAESQSGGSGAARSKGGGGLTRLPELSRPGERPFNSFNFAGPDDGHWRHVHQPSRLLDYLLVNPGQIYLIFNARTRGGTAARSASVLVSDVNPPSTCGDASFALVSELYSHCKQSRMGVRGVAGVGR
jgi:hypothetical protein